MSASGPNKQCHATCRPHLAGAHNGDGVQCACALLLLQDRGAALLGALGQGLKLNAVVWVGGWVGREGAMRFQHGQQGFAEG